MRNTFQALFAQLDIVAAKHHILLKRLLWPASLAVFSLTVLYWSFMGSAVHMDNADQLIDPRLFDSLATLQGAIFPGAHSFLLKWLLFWCISLAHHSTAAFFVAGIIMTGSIAALLVWFVTKIESRPAIRSLLVLAAASILLAIPAQPYPGALLPVNMSMLATRNLEYVCLLLAMWWALSRRSRWAPFAAAALLTLLFASDKLFVGLAFAAGAFALLLALLWRHKILARRAVRWILIVIVSFVAATLLLRLIDMSGLATVADGEKVSPYSIETQPRALLKATSYALSGALTNFGANPIDDMTAFGRGFAGVCKEIVHIGLIAHLVNLVLFAAALLGTGQLLRKRPKKADPLISMLIFMVGAAIGAIGLFIVTKHYYIVDARYLTIVFFALFLGLCIAVARKEWSEGSIVLSMAILLLAIAAGAIATGRTTLASLAAGQRFHERNVAVAQVLTTQHINGLVGDYWRVVPIKNMAPQIVITPLSSCSEKRVVLTSTQWNAFRAHPYAVLVSEDKSATDFPACSSKTMRDSWGMPTDSIQITSQEKLLIYR